METGAKGPPKEANAGEPTGSAATVTPPLCRESPGLKKKQLILMYTGYFTLDSPSVYLQTFISLPTVCARVRLACMCVCVCVLISIFLAIPSICYSLGFFALSVLSENLLFFYCRKSG